MMVLRRCTRGRNRIKVNEMEKIIEIETQRKERNKGNIQDEFGRYTGKPSAITN